MATPSAMTSGCQPNLTSKFRNVTLRPNAALARRSTIGRNQFQSHTNAATMTAPSKTTGMAINSRRFVVMLFGIAGRCEQRPPWLPISREHGTRENQVTFPPYSNRHCAKAFDLRRQAKQIKQPGAAQWQGYECCGIEGCAAGRFKFFREP